jgi:hypothetical protein
MIMRRDEHRLPRAAAVRSFASALVCVDSLNYMALECDVSLFLFVWVFGFGILSLCIAVCLWMLTYS